jgi:hypothetical protein
MPFGIPSGAGDPADGVLLVFGSSDLPTVRRALGEQRVTPRWTYVGGKQPIEVENEARTLEGEEVGPQLPSP